MKSIEYKKLITAYVAANLEQVANEFGGEEDMTPAMQVENWNQRDEDGDYIDDDVDYKEPASWAGSAPNLERAFDCEPYDDQLRAYIITDPTDTEIIRIEVAGE